MAQFNIGSATSTDFKNQVVDFAVDAVRPDGPLDQEETFWVNTKFTQWFGYYKQVAEFKKPIDAFATWVVGKGFTADAQTTVDLNHVTGWGEDTIKSIFWNMIVTKKIGGDAFAEIIRDEATGRLLNIKPLDPSVIRTVVDRKGRIKRYEQFSKTSPKSTPRKFEPKDILHLVNDRVADEIHGTSVTEACEWALIAKREAMYDWRKVLRRNVNPLKIWYTDLDDQTKINAFVTKIETVTKDKENIVIPADKVKVDVVQTPLVAPIDWMKYLDSVILKALGIPEVILGGSSEFTEASSKTAYLTFEQVYTREQEELENDLWNQLQIRIKFNKPASLMNELLSSEQKNTGQTSFQPNDVQAGSGKGAI